MTNNETIIKQIKNVRTDENRKKLYSLVKWVLEQDKKGVLEYEKIQKRITSCINSLNGYHKDYYHKNTKYQDKVLKRTTEHRNNNKKTTNEVAKIHQRKMRVAWSLYMKNKLSQESSNEISEGVLSVN